MTRALRYAGFLPGAALFLVLLLSPPPETPPALYPGNVVYARDGEILRVFLNGAEQWLLPWPSELAQVPRKLERAVLFSEDRYFQWHPGVNPGAIARAAMQNIRSGTIVSGGSTITMQLARILDPKPRTIVSKIVESLRYFF